MKIYNSKKARENWTPDTLPLWMFFSIGLSFTVLLFVWIIAPFVAEAAELPEGVKALILTQRFVNSPNCFAYLDEDSGRVYQKTVDWEKLTEENMKNCYQTEDKGISAFKLTLSIPLTDITKSIGTPNWREGYLVKESSFKDILVRYDGKLYKTRMRIEAQNV